MKVEWSWVAVFLALMAMVAAVMLVFTVNQLSRTVGGMADANECILFHIGEHRRSTRLAREADSAHHGYYVDPQALESEAHPPLKASCETAADDR